MEQSINNCTLISVIIPVYNVSEYINHCLKSIVNQSMKELEIILVDDGSTDGSGDLCDAWKEADHRISVYHTDNMGAAAARNLGLDVAKGNYITFVDADDYLEKNSMEIMWTMLNKHNASCCMCGYTPIDEQGRKKKEVAVTSLTEVSGIQAIKERYLHNRTEFNIINPWGKLFKAELWNEIRFTKGLYYEDLDVMPYLYHRCERIVIVPDNGYYYYLRNGSASRGTGTDHKRYTDSVLIRDKHIQFYKSIGEPDLSISVAQMLSDLIITSACNGWIPPSERNYSKKLFGKYFLGLIMSPDVTLKNKIRYSLFKLGGKRFYGWFIRK